MEEAALKIDLHEKIDHANPEQLKQLYGLVLNYFNSQYEFGDEKWDNLTEIQKESIEQGLKEADAGLGTPFEEVTKSLKEKYGLNGKEVLLTPRAINNYEQIVSYLSRIWGVTAANNFIDRFRELIENSINKFSYFSF